MISHIFTCKMTWIMYAYLFSYARINFEYQDYDEWQRLKKIALDSLETKTWIAEPPVCRRSGSEQVIKGIWVLILSSVNGDDSPHCWALLDTFKGQTGIILVTESQLRESLCSIGGLQSNDFIPWSKHSNFRK